MKCYGHLLVALQLLFGCLLGTAVGQHDPHCSGKTVIVHLFEWKWNDIAAECERFLGPAGYCGFQVSPPMEHVILPENNPPHPWWQRYQPVSYILHSRSGTPDEFADMVRRCNAVGVRTIVDAVINHMTGLGRLGESYAGSSYDGDAHDFPGVPFRREHFTPRSECPSGDGNVNNYGDPNNVRNCYLVGLTDLYGELEYVRDKVAGYLNNLADIGVGGIRIDAAKHMWPADIEDMMSRVRDLPVEHGFPPNARMFVYSEVIDRNDGAVLVQEYYDIGLVTEFRYCQKISEGIGGDFGGLCCLFDPNWGAGMAREDRAFVFVDNHDNQRGQFGGGVITHKTPREYKFAVAYMLAYPYGFAQVMSSYYFDNSDIGPPHNDDEEYSTADVPINADGSCGGGWVCEHRWNPIAKMVQFRNAVTGTVMENFWSGNGAVALSRGNKGFFAMAKQGLDESLKTGLPAGEYCNIIDDCATKITVGADSMARIQIAANAEEPFFATCVGCLTTGIPTGTAGTPRPTFPTTRRTTFTFPTAPCIGQECFTTQRPPSSNRTVIFIMKQTNVGQDVYIQGGIDHTIRPGCTNSSSTSACAIPWQISSLGTTPHYGKYDGWRVGDTKLDLYGGEVGQGSFSGVPATGTAMAWTSSLSSSPGYQPLNKFGDHYWMVEANMDCSQTEQGWFEVKAYMAGTGGGPEADIRQTDCSGAGAGPPPYTSTKRHMGRCGFVNVFTFGSGSCQILDFDL